jgi:hypothetical protein
MYMTQSWAPISSNGFRNILTSVFTKIYAVYQEPYVSESLKKNYRDLIFNMLAYFLDLRQNPSLLPDRIVSTLEALQVADNIHDIELVFKLLEVSLRSAETISFEEDTVVDFDEIEDSLEMESDPNPVKSRSQTDTEALVAVLSHSASTAGQTMEELQGERTASAAMASSTGDLLDFDFYGESTLAATSVSVKAEYAADNGDDSSPPPSQQRDPASGDKLGGSSALSLLVPPGETETEGGAPASSKNVDPPTDSAMEAVNQTAAVEDKTLSPTSAVIQEDREKESNAYRHWFRIRRGILDDKIDSERGTS